MLKFANKIDQSQVAEIRIMQDWLRAQRQAVRAGHVVVAPHDDGGHADAPTQLKELDAAKGVEFDRAFLELMIQHHDGALKMVEDLFAPPRAGQEVDVNVFANDVVTVQTAEIGRDAHSC